jgi:tRNA 5-methylaminomethyl-2-thiouridine biosynthesis bifunctional protein
MCILFLLVYYTLFRYSSKQKISNDTNGLYMFDVAIIGAGINGCSVAYELTEAGKRVVVFDMNSIAGGGSGAAGAFISPKFSKSGELKELLHEAFLYSMDFYEKNFPQLLTKAPLLHIAQDEADGAILNEYKKHASLELLTPTQNILNKMNTSAREQEHVSINAAIVNAEAMCQALCKSAAFVKEKVENLIYDEGSWNINEEYRAKELVLATGAYESLLHEPYLQLRGIWGHRIDVKTTTQNSHSLHQFVSISPSQNGVLAIGATHNVHYHPQTSQEPYDINAGREELLEKASRTLKLENIEVVKDYMGLRSGSFDYIPLVGPLVMSGETLQNKKINFYTKKPNYEEYSYYPNLTMINGNGGYGFVLAPYLAKMLKEYIVSDVKINERLVPARFFARWAKKC